jgi:hypothetical protein
MPSLCSRNAILFRYGYSARSIRIRFLLYRPYETGKGCLPKFLGHRQQLKHLIKGHEFWHQKPLFLDVFSLIRTVCYAQPIMVPALKGLTFG